MNKQETITDKLEYYINYWDDVVRRWFDENIDGYQKLFLDNPSLNLNSNHMPEPYWGNPEYCSIVIANYNPGGGADRNRHTFRECAFCSESFINQVKKKGYKKIAIDFPIIDQHDDKYNPLNTQDLCWWKEYGGREWWISKIHWLQKNIISGLPCEIDLFKDKPFAIEFCGWHSARWKSKMCSTFYESGKEQANVVNRLFVKPLVLAVKNSTTRLGICVGSQFYNLFNRMKTDDITIEHVTGKEKSQTQKYSIHLFKIDGANIIVLWGAGRNRYPNMATDELLPALAKQWNDNNNINNYELQTTTLNMPACHSGKHGWTKGKCICER